MVPSVLLLCSCFSCILGSQHWEYIIVGSGPAGLQMGYFLQKAERDYIMLERSNVSGSFYLTYPRHDRLISINKRNTGKSNVEFNLRHDWNSLLSDDPSLLFKEYSKDFFPWREDAVQYFHAFGSKLNLNIRYNTEVGQIQRVWSRERSQHEFTMKDQNGLEYSCRVLFVATGLWKPNVPDIAGLHLAEGYESASIDPMDYEGKTVLILGHGNAAFEVADSIYGHANVVHVVGRSRVRLAWETHYVGDVRAVNNGLLDTYQLKSMDGVVEGALNDVHFHQDATHPDRVALSLNFTGKDNFALRHSYDKIIRCLGFTFDDSIFHEKNKPKRLSGPLSKYPYIQPNHELVGLPSAFVLGTASHMLDFRKSSGGFIHGYRYTVRMVHKLLEWRYHGKPWPSQSLSLPELLTHVIKRLNEASGIYQMFGVLGDVITISDDGQHFEYLEEFPISLLPEFSNHTGHSVSHHFVMLLQYGTGYSGPGKDVFREDRATGQAERAHKSNFLHPVFYYYEAALTSADMASRPSGWFLPRPVRIHHMVEDFLTTWQSAQAHILPLRRFFEACMQADLRNFDMDDCFYLSLTHRHLPVTCSHWDLHGQGVRAPGSIGIVQNFFQQHRTLTTS